MGNSNHRLHANLIFAVALLAIWIRTADANALVSNLKSFTAGGVGGM